MKILQMLPAIILWSVVIVRLIGLRFGWRPGVLPAAGLVAAGATLNIDQVYLAVDGFLGGRNLLNVLVHLALGLGMTELSRLLIQATGRSSTRWRALVLAGAVLMVVQVVLLLSSDTSGSATNFTDDFGGLPTVAWYQATFFAWMGLITGYTGVECLGRNRQGESKAFRVGFDIISIACFAGVSAVTLKMVLIISEIIGNEGEFKQGMYLAYRVLIALTIVGFAVGFILPSYGRMRGSLESRGRRAKDMETLRPIVRRLVETEEGRTSIEAAGISLDAKSSKSQLYRWVILVGDIRVLHPELLSARENQLVDEIGERLAQTGSFNEQAAAAR